VQRRGNIVTLWVARHMQQAEIVGILLTLLPILPLTTHRIRYSPVEKSDHRLRFQESTNF